MKFFSLNVKKYNFKIFKLFFIVFGLFFASAAFSAPVVTYNFLQNSNTQLNGTPAYYISGSMTVDFGNLTASGVTNVALSVGPLGGPAVASYNSSNVIQFVINPTPANSCGISVFGINFSSGTDSFWLVVNPANTSALGPGTSGFYTSYNPNSSNPGLVQTLTSSCATSLIGLAVTYVNSSSGPSSGGTNITISGTEFTGASGATVGGAACTNFAVTSDSTITCTTPAGTPGTASVVVTNGGISTSPNSLFTYIQSAPTAVPTLSEYALIWMFGLLSVLGLAKVHKRSRR